MSLPWDVKQLIEDLDSTFPPRCIRKGETLEEAHRYAGKRELIEVLISSSEEEMNK